MLCTVRGLILGITKGKTVFGIPESFKVIEQGSILGLPNLIIAAIIIGIVSHIILEYTRFGYDVRCVGVNRQAVIAAGINVKIVRVLLFVISGIMCAIAGILVTGRLSVGTPSVG